jgi:hypothetical protein
MTDASSRSRILRTIRPVSPWTIGAVSSALILIVSACGQGTPQAGRNTAPPTNDIPCDTGERLAFHIHAHLAIYAGGQPLEVPYGIGIGEPWQIAPGPEGPFVIAGSCFRWLHTHKADGIIHIESPVQRTFTLGDFFGIWGQPLSTTEVGAAQGPVIAYVNGVRWSSDPGQITLQAHELIQLDVGDETPPQSFIFPPGA